MEVTNPYQHKVIAAMEDYNRVLEATEVAENANGVAAEKMTVYNESLEAAQNRLTASIQQFAQDSNLDRILALAYDGLSKVVEILNILLNKIPVLSPLIKEVGVALAVAFAAKTIANIASTSKAIGGLISAFTTVSGEVGAFASLVAGEFVASLSSGLIPAIGAAGTAITTLLGPVGTILALLGAVVAIAPAVYSAWQKMFPSVEERAESSKKALEESNTKLEETKSQMQEIAGEIKAINEKGTLTLADEAEKERLQEQLDLLEKIRENQEKINEQNKAEALKTEQAKAGTITGYSEESVSQYRTALSGAGNYAATLETGDVNALIAAYKELGDVKKQLNSSDEDYAEQVKQNEELAGQFSTKLLEQKQAALEEMQALANLGDTTSEQYQKLQALVGQIDITLDPSSWGKIEIGQLIDESGFEGVLSNLHDKTVQAVQKAGQDGSKEAQAQAKQAMSQLDGYITAEANKIAEKIGNDEGLKKQFAEWLNIDPNDIDVNQIFEVVKQQLSQAYGVSADVANTATTANKEYNASLTTTSELADMVSQSEVDLANDTKSLSDAYNAMIKNGKITKTQMAALIKQYPELTDAIEVQNGVIRINTKVLQDKYQEVLKTHDEIIQDQIDETNAVIEQTKERIKAYQAEITALQTVQLSRNVFVDETIDPETGAGIAGRSQSVEGKGGNRFGSASVIQNAIDAANKQLDEYQKKLDILLASLHTGDSLTYTGSSKSGKSDAEKAAEAFKKEVEQNAKYLKGIVTEFSLDDAWDDPATVKKYSDKYSTMLEKVVGSKEARDVIAKSLNIDISDMSDEEAKEKLTKVLAEQYGDIQTEYQKLLKNKAKEDLNSAKTIINAYKEGVYGAWSSDEALNAAKADYDKFIKEITDNEDYRKAVAESLNLGDITGKTVEEQIRIVVEAWQKSTGTLEDAQQDLYDDASKNIKALQDEIEDMLDTAIDLLEKAGDFLFDMLGKISDRYDAQIDNLDKISDELDDQKDAFEDKIDQQKELLKLQKEEMDNADELAEKNKSIADIDAQLMELQYDDSAEAQAKRLKLLDERAEKEKDLAEWQKDNDYDTKVAALEKEKSEYEKTIEAEKKAIEAQKKVLEETQKQFETTLKNIQNGFNTFIKILSSDLVKNLISKALINTGSDTVSNLLIGYNKIFGSGIDTDVTGIVSKAFKSLGEIGGKLTGGIDLSGLFNGFDLSGVFKNIGTTLNGITQNFSSFAKGISRVIQPGIQSASGIFKGLGDTLKGVFSLDWNGIVQTMQLGLGTVSGVIGDLFAPIAKGAASIGDAIGSGITGFFPGIFTALGTLVSTVGTAMGGVLSAIAEAMASIPVVGWAIAAAAVVGAVALVATIASIVSKTKSSKVSQPTQSFTAKKHHTGADYVKKENPALDKMLGLNDDETVSILHVGEAVVPTWANNATSSSSSNRFTGASVSSGAVDTAIKSANVSNVSSNTNNTTNSPINISMPINIQGDADTSTVTSLKKEADNIVNRVLKTINNQTRIGGYKNIKAATV